MVISVISGFGELLGYGLRLFSGRGADRTGLYWPITIGGYILQMSVGAIARLGRKLAGRRGADHPGAGRQSHPQPSTRRDALPRRQRDGLRLGLRGPRGARSGRRDVGPLLIALILAASHHDYRIAFAALAVPAAIMLSLLAVARWLYPRPQDLEPGPAQVTTRACPGCSGSTSPPLPLSAAGFADFPIIAYHFQRSPTVRPT